ncbi:hypothetical protein EYF80_033605 [Liparis tanakae]|uniref:Uncharacterized protein n=1 Tax=Liparis tanakae TaxID=230148 RepID=A0A4Z2GSB8_9TELE|nr:hypothetical protein EYF80_033605 [Liparis tanakae]
MGSLSTSPTFCSGNSSSFSSGGGGRGGGTSPSGKGGLATALASITMGEMDPIGPSRYARCPGNQHLRLNVCHGNSALVDVFLDRLLGSIQQRFGVDGFIHQT